jgi:hypothetical protein
MGYQCIEVPSEGGIVTIAEYTKSCINDIKIGSLTDTDSMLISSGITTTATGKHQLYFNFNPNTSDSVHLCNATVNYKANNTSCSKGVYLYQQAGYEVPVTPPSSIHAYIEQYVIGYEDSDANYHSYIGLDYGGVDYTTGTVEAMVRSWTGPTTYTDSIQTLRGFVEVNPLHVVGHSASPTYKYGDEIMYIKCGGAHFGDTLVIFTNNTQCRS